MWIDINAYVGHWPFKRLHDNDCASLVKKMDKYGVSMSVISNLNGIFYKNTQSANQELHNMIESLRNGRDRFIPFAVINPIYAGWEHDLDECVNKLGMKGLRLYPKYHDYEIDNPNLIRLVIRAKDYGIPVSFVFRMVDSRERSWMDIDYVYFTKKPEWNLENIIPIIKLVPNAKYMILNAANSLHLTPEQTKIFNDTDLLIDTSGRALSDLGSLLRLEGGKDRFAFGTHYPILDYLTGMLRIESLREDEADETEKELLRSGNAKLFLRI